MKFTADVASAREYITSGAARTDLLASGVQPTEIQWHQRTLKRVGLFGRLEWVDEVIHARGWIIGDFEWEYRTLGDTIRRQLPTAVIGTPWRGQTGLVGFEDRGAPNERLIIFIFEPSSTFEPQGDAIRDLGKPYSDHAWILIAQAIRQLIGTSS